MSFYLKDGFIRQETDIDIYTLNAHLDKISNMYANEKIYGNNGFLKIIQNDDTIMELAGKKIINVLHQKLKISPKLLNQSLSSGLYYTNDKKNTSHRNQLPHFDHIRKLKVFLYLDEIDDNTGPTEFSSKSNQSFFMKYIRVMRFFLPIGTKGMKNIFFWKKFSDKLTFSKAIGKKGDIYVFDTDTIHKAGLVTDESKTRKLLRFDFEINLHHQNLFLFFYKKLSLLIK